MNFTPAQQLAIQLKHQQVALKKRQIADLRALCTPKQLALIDDPSDQKTALTCRQTGKTWASAIYLLLSAIGTDNCECAYLGPSRNVARKAIYGKLKEFNEKLKLGAKINNAEMSLTFSNRSVITLYGIDVSSALKERLRGMQFKLIVIDECGVFKQDLNEITDAILGPAMWKHAGTIVMISTPGLRKDFFYRAAKGLVDGWSRHTWTIDDNPDPTIRQQYKLKAAKRLKEYGPKDPYYLREYCGEFVDDDSAFVYALQPDNFVNALPALAPGDSWTYHMGIDWGLNASVVVLAYNKTSPVCYVVDEWKKSNCDPFEHIEKIIDLKRQWKASRIVADSARADLILGVNARHKLNIEATDNKIDKAQHVDYFNAELRRHAVMLVRDAAPKLAKEMTELEWDHDVLREKAVRIEDKGRFENHLCDATLYCWWQAVRAYTSKETNVKPVSKEQLRDPIAYDMLQRAEKERQQLLAARKRASTRWGTFNRLGLLNADRHGRPKQYFR
jgi:hypothetical protein